MEGINVLSLFDGMSCGQIALERAGIKVKNYFASEIDKYAIKVTQKNYPNTIQLGSVTDVYFYDGHLIWNGGKNDLYVGKIDLVLAGSPCQGFSFAGKQLNFNDLRSKLFFDFVRLLKECKPKYFLLENVKMKKEYEDIISKEVSVEPILINSALVSAQNRKRLYWTNILNVCQPEDKKIYLKDIIESGVVDRDKSFCVDASYFKGRNLKQYFEKHRRQLVFDKSYKIGYFNSGFQGDRVYSVDAKSVTLSANGGGRGAKTGLYLIPVACVSERGRRLTPDGAKRDDKNGKIVREYEVVSTEKINCLTTVTKENYICEDLVIRKLTPIECERLQTVPDNYTDNVSNSQRYKMLGNGWTVDVIVHILQNMEFNEN